jgi:arylformamidase
MARVPRFLDVSVPLAPDVPTYPGNPPFEFQPVKRIANGDSSNVSRMVMGTHTATHVDAPLHFFPDGAGADALSLELLMGRARVVDIPRRGGITADDLAAAGLREDLRVLLKTPNSALWNGGGPFKPDYTHLTESAAKYLVEQGVKVVGVDYLSVEEFKKPGARAPRPALPGGGDHRRTQPLRCRARHVRAVLSAAAHRGRGRRPGARRPQALGGPECSTTFS